MVKMIEVSSDQVKYVGTNFPHSNDVDFAENLWNFFHTIKKLSPLTGLEPYTAIVVMEAERVDVYCETSDPLTFSVSVFSPKDFSNSLAAKIVEIVQEHI